MTKQNTRAANKYILRYVYKRTYLRKKPLYSRLQMKNRDEEITLNYLGKFYDNVLPGPNPNETPDIVINSTIAVEVRRLNQQYYAAGKMEGLENFYNNLCDCTEKIFKSINYNNIHKSYIVSIDFTPKIFSAPKQRNDYFKQIKINLKTSLLDFLSNKDKKLPYEISVDSNITYEIVDVISSIEGKLFINASPIDSCFGGKVISNYKENIQFCITEKSIKVERYLANYKEWWLFLVDYLGGGLGILKTEEINDLISSISDTGNFNKIYILSSSGDRILTTIPQ